MNEFKTIFNKLLTVFADELYVDCEGKSEIMNEKFHCKEGSGI